MRMSHTRARQSRQERTCKGVLIQYQWPTAEAVHLQPESLTADGIEIWQLHKLIVWHFLAILLPRFENLLTKTVLCLRMLRKHIKHTCHRVRRRVYPGNDERPNTR